MNTFQKLIDWLDHHPESALDIVRAYLGVGLFVRGVLLINDPMASVEQLTGGDQSLLWSAALVHYIAFAHLFGGGLLAVGLLTRIAAFVQIPILVGAVFVVHTPEGLLSANQSLEFSALVLVLLITIFLFGAGRWSADYYVFEREPAEDPVREVPSSPEKEPAFGEPEPRVGRRPVPAGAATRAAHAKHAVASTADVVTCSCGNDINHPRVTVEPRYSTWALVYFLFGITAPVKEVIFWCEKCGTVMKRSRDPEVLQAYRYRS